MLYCCIFDWLYISTGPYVCGEHEYGALPWWLLKDGTDTLVPRTNEATFMKAVDRWYAKLLPMLVPFLYRNGGPIVTVQVENEYGSYYACDSVYTGALRDLFKKYLGDETVLFTVGKWIIFFEMLGVAIEFVELVLFGVIAFAHIFSSKKHEKWKNK